MKAKTIKPMLWFDNQAEEAARFYVSIFEDSRIDHVSEITVAFTLRGQEFVALNGGPMFKFNESISLEVTCKDQDEVDYLWKKLTADGGQESMCGWLKDKYGLSWQIVPSGLVELLSGKEPEKSNRAAHALMQMRKIDINVMRAAYEGK